MYYKIQITDRLLSYLIYFVICIFLAYAPLKAQSQFFFPSIETLKTHQVKTLKVYQKPMYYKGGSAEERNKLPLDTTRFVYQIFYFNDFGYVDSTIYYPTETGFQRKVIYIYNGRNMVESKSISNTGVITNHWLLTQNENNEFCLQSWENGILRSRVTSNSDSIMIESLYFENSDTDWKNAIWFNPENDTRIEHSRNGEGEYIMETFQWFTDNGQPKAFKHMLEQKETPTSKIVYKEKTYDLDSTGNVVNKYTGRFDDPYLHYNYYDRYEKFKPFTFNEQNKFRQEKLFNEIEVSTLYTFSGIELVYLYVLEYEFW